MNLKGIFMHTETEAKNLWCPLVRHEGESAGSFNRGWAPHNPLNQTPANEEESYLCNCIGSRCMAWRWGRNENQIDSHSPGRRSPPDGRRIKDLASTREIINKISRLPPGQDDNLERHRVRTGYCGMIGRSMNPLSTN